MILLLICSTTSLVVGGLTNFIKPKWSWITFSLLICTGIVIFSLRDITWNYGVLEEIWRIVFEGTIWYLFPVLLIMGVPFLIGRYGYQFVVKSSKGIKKTRDNK